MNEKKIRRSKPDTLSISEVLKGLKRKA